MPQVYHVLNGDALKAQFPSTLAGEQIVARECLVDGPVNEEPGQPFWQMRANFMEAIYNTPQTDYYEKTVLELSALDAIVPGSMVNLWFEEDLFCQVNMWFVVAWLLRLDRTLVIAWVHPDATHNWLGFGGSSADELFGCYKKKFSLSAKDLNLLQELWTAYQQDDYDHLIQLADKLSYKFTRLPEVVQAHIDRFPVIGPGRPRRRLLEIMERQNTKDFGPVFQEFCKTEGIYGFGDMQVKRLFDDIV